MVSVTTVAKEKETESFSLHEKEVVTGSGVLHNMSARPRTEVICTVRPLQQTWASFTLAEYFKLDALMRERLNHAWEQVPFKGAALVQLPSTAIEELSVRSCSDFELSANVVLRTRGSLLLGEMPLLDYAESLKGHTIISSDARLVAWAGGCYE